MAVTATQSNRIVSAWLLTGVIMIIIQTLLGGVTRLTGSGLSITEWKPIMGALPPLNEADWNKAFDGYKQIGQYKYLNSDFTLHDFQFIFFWEWFHRLWARLLGVVFAIGFIYFLVKGYFKREMVRPLIILFLLGGMQGLIGWLMVQSGINNTDLFVNHTRLAIHFIAAMVLACYTLWFALQLLVPQEARITHTGLRNGTIGLLALLGLQLTYGAFMAGLKAAMTAHTWPGINGMWVPANLLQNSLINDRINVHFVHRTLAFLLVVSLAYWFMRAGKAAISNVWLNTGRKATVTLVLLQAVLGIVTVISAPRMVWGKFGLYEILAESHQLVAMFLLMSLMYNLFLLAAPPKTME
ncbi:MAG: heme A synthase [Chitinophagia bacterium]|nr:heme A synthase [Chitinophagia bacterium]